MNIFRFFADLSHLASILILIFAIKKNRSSNGLSLKSQILYLIVFITRYLDLFVTFYSLYNFILKIFFITSTLYTIYLIAYKHKMTDYEANDTFPYQYLILVSFIFSLIFTHDYDLIEIAWSFSLWLESVSIIPQLFILEKTREAENITTHFIFSLGLYRALYIPNWIYRFYFQDYIDYIPVVSGIIQTVVYSDFFYIYYTKVLKGKKFELPV